MIDRKTKWVLWVMLGIVLGFLVQMMNYKCGRSRETRIDTVYTTDTVWIGYDSTYKTEPTGVSYTDTSGEVREKIPEPPAKDDTVAVLADYQSAIVYNDSVKIPYGYVRVSDTVSRNRLEGREISVHQDLPRITNTVTIAKHQPPSPSIMVGGGISAPLGVSASLSYLDGKGRRYGARVHQMGAVTIYSLETEFTLWRKR